MSTIQEEIARLQQAKEDIKDTLEARGVAVPEGASISTYSSDVEALPSIGSVTVQGISISKSSTSIGVGDSETITATISPAEATNQNINWESSDTDVAVVIDGVITAVGAGSATISAVSEEGRYTATCSVTAVLLDFGYVDMYSGWSRSMTITQQLNCSVDSIDYGTFFDWYDQQPYQSASDKRINYTAATGKWQYVGSSETIDDISEIGLSVTLPMPGANASIIFSHQWIIDTGETIRRSISLRSDYGSLGEQSDVFYVEGDIIPREAIYSYGFGEDCTQTSNYFLTGSSRMTSIDFQSATSLTTIGTHFADGCGNVNCEIAIPNSVTSIGEYFMYNCDRFNSPITLSSNLTTIGKRFLSGMELFNQSVTIPNSVTSVGDYFLAQNPAFNSQLTLSNSMTNTGNYLLSGCSSFNQPIILPPSLSTVGINFLANCVAFNQPLTIHNNIGTVSAGLLSGCSNYTSTLTVNGAAPTGSQMNTYLTTKNSTDPMYATGVTITGATAQDWRNVLPDLSGPTRYRKLNLYIPVTGVSLSPSSISVATGSTSQLTTTITPANATNQNVTYTSSDTSIATVSSTGLVTAVASGNTTIKVTTVDGGFEATTSVTVPQPTGGYGSIVFYSSYWRDITPMQESGCTLNDIDQDIFLSWYEQQEPGWSCEFSYSDGQWTYNWMTPIEDMAAIGIDVTVTEEWATLSLEIGGWQVDKSAGEDSAAIASSSEFDQFANGNQSEQYSVILGGKTIPFMALKEFEVGESVESLPACFLYASAVEYVDFSNASNLTSIGEFSLTQCHLITEPMEIPGNVASIGNYFLFQSNFDAQIDINDGVGSIGQGFLQECSNFNHSISIPDSVTSIGDNFLSDCTSLDEEVTLQGGFTSIGMYFMSGCGSYNRPLSIPEGVTSIGLYFLKSATSFNSELILPNSLTTIDGGFMQECTSFDQPLTLPNSVTSIDDYFLYECNTFNSPLTLSSGLLTIGNFFMDSCSSFNQPITLPNGLTTIGKYFMSTSWAFNQPITLHNSVTSIGEYFLYDDRQYISTITIETQFVPTNNLNSYLSVQTSSTAPMYITGVTLAGTYAQAWKNALPDRSSVPYRKLIVSA